MVTMLRSRAVSPGRFHRSASGPCAYFSSAGATIVMSVIVCMGSDFLPVLCLLALSPCCANQRKQRDHDGHPFHIDLLPFRVNRDHLRYCASVTCSIHSTALPLSSSCTAMCVIAVFGVAPCQCFTPAGLQITSPFRSSSIGPSHLNPAHLRP